MEKAKDLVIKAPSQGIASSPHVGYGNVRNLDIFRVPGIAKVNWQLEKKSGTTITGTPKWIVSNPLDGSQIWTVDSNGAVYKSTNDGATWSLISGNTSGGVGQGLAIWKDYVFVPRSTAIDVYGPLSGSPAWSNSWKTDLDAATEHHPMTVSFNDGKLYIGAGRYVASLDETSGSTFAPGTSASFTWTPRALDLPPNYKIRCISELGKYLLLGTWIGVNIYDNKIADIFPWDRSSVSFEIPVRMSENGVSAMLNVNNIVYVLAGLTGKVFTTNGYQATEVARIPEYVVNIDGAGSLYYYPGAIMHHQGKVYFGVSNSASSGVWSLTPTAKGNVLVHEHTISTGGGDSNTTIGSLLSISSDYFLVGWKNSTSYGIDATNTSRRYTTYLAYFESPFYTVGTNLAKRQFTQLEFQLAKPLSTGQGLKIYYRTDLTSDFTLIGTYDNATLGSVISHNTTADIPACESVQIKCELTCYANDTKSPEIKSITLR